MMKFLQNQSAVLTRLNKFKQNKIQENALTSDHVVCLRSNYTVLAWFMGTSTIFVTGI